MRGIVKLTCALIALGGATRVRAQEAFEAARFQAEVLPVLSDKCFLCHGPDAGTRRADLRLDLEDAARGSGVLEVDEDGYSEFLDRIESAEDPNYHMPPPEANLALTAGERSTLRAWIEAGAPYEPHWAFVPPVAVISVPDLAGTGADVARWASPIDRFAEATRQRVGLQSAPPASPERWLRRVTLDLTGLPPTLLEMDALLEEDSPTRREAVVERLLQSPRFAERMATPWLDVARYADSYGYQSDLLSPTWPYRDWVVRAIDENLPYDRFLTLQLAGDLVEDPSQDDRLATAFQRLHRMTNEGGSVEEEWRHAYAVDRVETLGSAVMGLTLGCARCHDHKYDPIAQSEFYGLFAFFNSIDEWGMYHDSSRVPTPSLLLPSEEEAQALAEMALALDAIDGNQDDRMPVLPLTLDGIRRGTEVAALRFDDGSSPWLGLDGDTAVALAGTELDYGPTTPFSLECRVWVPEGLDDAVILHRSGGSDVGYFGFDIVLMGAELMARQVRYWPGNAATLSAGTVPRGEWFDLVYAQEGTGRASEMVLWVNGERRGRLVRDGLKKLPGVGPGALTAGARFRDSGFAGGRIDDLVIRTQALGDGSEGRRSVRRAMLERQTPLVEVPVMEELPERRPAYTLERGAYDAPKSEENLAPRAFPSALMGEAEEGASESASRLDLARWLTSPGHPLTSRVAVNRIWQVFFGTGLVATADDFGLQGSPPSHPELLDWLARRFVDSGWDLRALCREIVLSETYGQDSAAAGDGVRERDPENRFLARGPSGRLSAEMLRDSALLVAGLLDERRGGPPVSPYQPAGFWRKNNSMSPAYKESVGTDRYRRSLYSVVKRTAPLPNMTLFDKPMREVSCARREATVTPLQGLVLLNDVQFVEAATAAAARAAEEGGTLETQIVRLFRRWTGRRPDGFEQEVLARVAAEGGGLARVATTIMALDASVWKR